MSQNEGNNDDLTRGDLPQDEQKQGEAAPHDSSSHKASDHRHRGDGHRWFSLPEHRALVDALGTPSQPVWLPTQQARGCVLAEPVSAALSVPPFTNSAMDGFAVRHSDIAGASHDAPVELPVSGDIPAGAPADQPMPPGTAMRIMTGAKLPEGADTVVKVEQTDHGPGISCPPSSVSIFADPGEGANVRYAGEDLTVGDQVLHAGWVVDAASVAAAVSVGVAKLKVIPIPRVGILTTGSELRGAGESLASGQIPDSNGFLLAGLVHEAGAQVAAQDRVPDNPFELSRVLASWPQIDLLITAGGISAGAYEVVRQALSGNDMSFHHVAQQPGGPQGIGSAEVGGRTTPVMCLPGNPVSVFVSFQVYAAGLIRMIAGRAKNSVPEFQTVMSGAGWASPAEKTQFMPVRRNDDGTVAPVHPLGSKSHLVASLPLGEGLVVVPAGVAEVHPGDQLDYLATRHI